MCPMGFYQGNEGCSDLTQIMEDQDNHLYQQYLDHIRVCSAGSTVLGGVNSHPYHQHQEVSDDLDSGNRIPEHDGKYQYLASQSSSR